MLFTWFMLTGLIFLIAPPEWTNDLQLTFHGIFSLPLSIGRNISLSAGTQQPVGDEYVASRDKYEQLQKHIANLEETLFQQRKKFEKLYGLYNEYVWEGVDFVLADVITANIDGSRSEFTIERREKNNKNSLVKDQFVLGDNSIIGTITDVSSSTASVKLFTDPTSSIEVKIGKLNAIMKGNGNNSAKIPLVSIEHKIKKDDNVFALKKAGFLDAPVIIGRVDQLKRDDKNPLLWDITVEPVCDFEQLNNVAVIVMNPPEVR